MTTGFVKAKCAKCKNEQMIFGKPATEVKCLVCGGVLAEPSGGRGIMAAPKAEEKTAVIAAKPELAATAAKPELAATAAKSPVPKTEAAPARKKAESASE